MRRDFNRVKKGLAVLLSACMVLTMTPIQAGAEETVSGSALQTESTEQDVRKEGKILQNQSAKTVTGFEELDRSVMYQQLAIGAKEEKITFPDKLTVTLRTQTKAELSGITWKLKEEESDGAVFDSSKACNGYCYVYTPVLPETDADRNRIQVAEDAELPMIYVLIGKQQVMTLSVDHYNANGFCTGYELKSDGTWGKKEGESACTEEGCSGYQPADLTTSKYDIDDDGSKDEVYEIGNAGQLYWFAGLVNGDKGVCTEGVTQNKNANAVLTANITVNANVLKEDGTLSEDTSSFRNWTPIGYFSDDDSVSCSYSGKFDGRSHTISGLYFNDTAEWKGAGLFGEAGGDAVISNVGITASYFKGYSSVGGVCGTNYGKITGSYNTGTVAAMSDCTGGVCGYNKGGVIENCYNDGNINGGDAFAGGVCGYILSGTIINSYNTGNVTATGSNGVVGGVCGYILSGTIINSYNIGNVTATGSNSSVGGVCGENNGTIANSHSTGNVTATGSNSSVGGVCGIDYSTIANCYFDSTVYSGDAVGGGSGTDSAAEGKTTDQFAGGEVAWLLSQGYTIGEGDAAVTYDGSAWGQKLGGEVADTYPVLDSTKKVSQGYNGSCKFAYSNSQLSQTPVHSFGTDGFCTDCKAYQPAKLTTDQYDIDGNGSKDEVYEIGNAGQLYWFAGLVNGDESVCTEGVTQNLSANAVLTADITVNGNVLKPDGTLSDSADNFRSWTPMIGNNSDAAYRGCFDGQSHDISGLYFSNPDANFVGLFGTVGAAAIISNVGIVDSYFKANSRVGGVCGYSRGEITGCLNAGSVIGRDNVGGVCGYNSKGEITGCYNTGMVTYENDTTGSDVGGVCGNNYGTIKGSYNTGKVKVTASSKGVDAGGVCGYNYGTLSGSYNTGEVTADGSGVEAGGVCGYNYGTLSGSYNTGEVTAGGSYGYAGGVCGYNYGTLLSSYSTGKVTANASDGVVAGGVCGVNDNTITNCCFDSTNYDGDAVGSGSGTATATEGKTAAQFASGEAAYLLNEGKTDRSQAWYQNIDNGEKKDGIPVLDSKHGIVYKSAPCPIKYSNSDEEIPHSFALDPEDDTQHTCTNCGLSEKHADVATFTVDSDAHSISAGCSSCGWLGTITLSAADAVYDGEDKAASVSGTIKGITIPSIDYERKNGETYTKIDGVPRDAGTYRAGITLGTGANAATVNVDYEIAKVATVMTETPEASAITYGDTLADSALTGGKVICRDADGNELAGTFSWKDGSIKPSVSDSGVTEYDVVFTPEDSVNYNTVETSVTLTVNKAAKAPKMPDDVMQVEYLNDVVEKIELPENWRWSEEDKDTALAVNTPVTVTAVYTGKDKGNYEIESVSVTVTRNVCTHKNTERKNVKEATCTQSGYSGDSYCKDCGILLQKGKITELLGLGHVYNAPQYTWEKDAAGKMTCTAVKVCTRTGCADTEENHTVTEKVTATDAVTKEPTCETKGTKTYTAVFTKDGFTTQTKTEEIAVIDHTLTAVEAKEATATEPGNKAYFVCGVCGKFFEDSEGTKEITDKTSVVIPAKGMTPTPTPGASETPATIPTTEPVPVPPMAEPSDEVTAQPAGTKIKDSTGTAYKVTKSVNGSATVQYAAPADKVKGSVSIPATVTIGKETYKVTSVAANAFKNKKNITCIIIGKNVRKIGKNAFAGCKKLKKIIIKTKKLTKKSVAKGAFRGVGKKVVVQVPKSKYKAYKKLLRAKGMSKKARVKKGKTP